MHTHPGLRAILSIMLGDERALRDASHSWPELLCALLFWRFTDASPQLHLGQLLASCSDQMAVAAAGKLDGGEDTNEGFLEFLKEVRGGCRPTGGIV